MKNILFVISDGIGNQIETIPAFFLCRKKYPGFRIVVYNIVPTNIEATKVIFRPWVDDVFFAGKNIINKNQYFGQILTFPMINKVQGIRVLNEYIIKNNEFPEVISNCYAVSKHFDDSIFSECKKVFQDIATNKNAPDIILHNGYSKINKKSAVKWEVKSYPYYEKLATELKNKGYRVGSIGSKDEYIQGSEDFTGLSFANSISVLKGTKLIICNDTSSYHLANILEIKNIAIFTCTDNIKNYSKLFHRFTTIIRREDLSCSPCQRKQRDGFWINNRSICKWKCREISIDIIMKKVEELI